MTESPDEPVPTPSLPLLSYAIAYELLPNFAFKDMALLMQMMEKTGDKMGAFLYLWICDDFKVEAD